MNNSWLASNVFKQSIYVYNLKAEFTNYLSVSSSVTEHTSSNENSVANIRLEV